MRCQKIQNLSPSDVFFQAPNAPKSVFGRTGPRWRKLLQSRSRLGRGHPPRGHPPHNFPCLSRRLVS